MFHASAVSVSTAQSKSSGAVSAVPLPRFGASVPSARSGGPGSGERQPAGAPSSPRPAADGGYGSLLDTLYRCRLASEASDRRGREVLLLHKAHVASYRAAGLLGSPQSLPHDDTAAAAAADCLDESVERLTVQLEAASSTERGHSSSGGSSSHVLSRSRPSTAYSASPQHPSYPHVDTAVFSDSDWSDDDDSGDSPDSHERRGELSSSALLRPSVSAPGAVLHMDDQSQHSRDFHSDGRGSAGLLLLERLLLLYVDVYCDQPEAFAPFAKRGSSVHESATLLYEHITQKTHTASAFHSLTRNLRWLSVKSHLIAFFNHELQGRIHAPAPLSRAAATAASGSSNRPQQPSHAHASPAALTRVHALLSSFYHSHGAAITTTVAAQPIVPASAVSHASSLAAPSKHGPVEQSTVSRTDVGLADYFRLFNVACSELHALYTAASSTINAVLETSVLRPATFDGYDSAEQVNAAVIETLRSAAVMELIASYHTAYQRAVLTSSPGYVLLSRTMRHRIESDTAFLSPASFTDLIVAVHGVSALLITAFQTIVAAHAAAAFALLNSPEQLNAMRSKHQRTAATDGAQQQEEVESVSAWLYDSRLYPKPLTAETFPLLAMLQVRDATVLREIAAERFEEAAERLKALDQPDKAALLTSLTQQRQQQKEALMSREIADASRASHLGLSTASFNQRHSTSDSVHIELLRSDSDHDIHRAASAAKAATTTSAHFETISPNPNLPTRTLTTAPHLQPKTSAGKAEERSVKLDDVLRWIDISPQYVVGLGRDSDWADLRAIAVFDKTFTEPTFSNIKDILVTGLTTRERIHSTHMHKAASHTSKTMADFVEAVLFSSSTNSESVQVPGDFFADPLIVWREGKKPFDVRRIRQPLPFNDIDWLQMFVENPALTGILHTLCDVSSLVDSESDVRKPLSHATFVPQVDKDGVTTGFVLPLHRSKTARPVKVVDLKYPNSSYVHSATRATYTNAIKGALSDSPIYGPTQAVNAALERIFDFTDILYLQKQAQALLLVAEAIDGHPHSPFAHSVFSRADLDAAIFYLLRSNIMLSAVFVNLFTANSKLTANYLQHIHDKRDTSLLQLQKRHLTVLPLAHSFFALTILHDPHSGVLTRLKLFVLGFTKLGRSAKPHCAVDFLRPTRETKKRLALQYILTGANFIYIPFPGANGLPKIIYKELVVREQNRRQMWEAGLMAHIQHCPGELTALFAQHLRVSPQAAAQLEEQALLILQDRKLSPLDLDVVEREQHRDVVERWLERQDHVYSRVQPRTQHDSQQQQQPTRRGVLLNAEQMLRLASP